MMTLDAGFPARVEKGLPKFGEASCALENANMKQAKLRGWQSNTCHRKEASKCQASVHAFGRLGILLALESVAFLCLGWFCLPA